MAGGLELTSGEREYVDNLPEHAEKRDGKIVLRGKPRARVTVVEGDNYYGRARSEHSWVLPIGISVILALVVVAAYAVMVHR